MTVGTLGAIWRFPVKSMQGESIDEVKVTERGIVGDRAYALVDVESGKVVSAKSVRLYPDVLRCHASYVEGPGVDDDVSIVQVTLPDGTTVRSDAPDIDATLSRALGREVRLASTAPEDFTIDMYHPDIEGVDPAGRRGITVDQKLGSAIFAQMGIPSPVPAGAFFDVYPMSILTTSTLHELSSRSPGSLFDQRRFRMNLVVSTEQVGFVENDWIGSALDVGGSVRLRPTMPDARCVMTTLAQPGLPSDPEVLRALVRHNRRGAGGGAATPCAGVYAVVEKPGLIRVGDPVVLA